MNIITHHHHTMLKIRIRLSFDLISCKIQF